MGKDFFGKPRFHCKEPSCNCNEYLTQSQIDLKQAEEDDLVEELESKYHNMTCQARSTYQLHCICGHDADRHSSEKMDRVVLVASGYEFEESCTYQVLHDVCFRKDGADPEKAGIRKVKRSTGTPLSCTSRRWRGPSGGLWAELAESEGQKPGWVLVEGPGFGVDGPLLAKGLSLPLPEAKLVAEVKPAREAKPTARADAAVAPTATAKATTVTSGAADAKSAAADAALELTLLKAQDLLRHICALVKTSKFQEADPVEIGDVFIGELGASAREYGFDGEEAGVGKMLLALKAHADNLEVKRCVADVEESLQLGPDDFFRLVDALATEPEGL